MKSEICFYEHFYWKCCPFDSVHKCNFSSPLLHLLFQFMGSEHLSVILFQKKTKHLCLCASVLPTFFIIEFLCLTSALVYIAVHHITLKHCPELWISFGKRVLLRKQFFLHLFKKSIFQNQNGDEGVKGHVVCWNLSLILWGSSLI